MKPEFDNAYQNLFYEYPMNELEFFDSRFYRYRNRDLLRALRNSIIQLDQSISPDKHLRSDAMYFLLINFHHMILSPLAQADSNYIDSERANVFDDLKTIITLAKESSLNGEISGHAVMNIINNSWRDLKTTRLSLWGDDKRVE
jgi:hypothetical protein